LAKLSNNPAWISALAWIFGVTLLIGAVTRREEYHKTLVVFGMAAFILYIALFFTRLQ
jgi:hypothetical protein